MRIAIAPSLVTVRALDNFMVKLTLKQVIAIAIPENGLTIISKVFSDISSSSN